jgi:hypothetical protein
MRAPGYCAKSRTSLLRVDYPSSRCSELRKSARTRCGLILFTSHLAYLLLCVLDELRQMDADDPWLGGRLDFNAVGTLGMSFGGSSTGSLCLTNDAIKCAAFLDGAFHFEVNADLKQNGIQKPFLAMNNDNTADPSLYFWPESKHLFDLAETNAVIFQVSHTIHQSFEDIYGWLLPASQPWSSDFPGTTRVIDACLVCFFDKYLKGQDDHFLDQAPPKYPDEIYEVLNFHRK